MNFESAPKKNNKTEEINNPSKVLINETFDNVEYFTKTRDGKRAINNAWKAGEYNPDNPRKEYSDAKEKYETAVEKEGGIGESLKEQIGANRERVRNIMSRMQLLAEKKKEIAKKKMRNSLSKTLLAFGAGGSLAGISSLVSHAIDQAAVNQMLDTPGGKIAAVATIASMCGAIIAPFFAEPKSSIEESIEKKNQAEEDIKQEISDSIEDSQSGISDSNLENI